MATVYKIHPAIGIARVGNSPDEFFIGPERLGEYPDPTGGFKDAQCRVKRQAARFHIYAHHDDGTFEEITDAEADISWTVHLVNKKAANPGRGNSESASDLTIDPGARMVNGPNQIQTFDTGQIKFSGISAQTVPLGEIRSDDENHLLVLGGFGKSASPPGTIISDFWANRDWYDDVSDGPVTATIKIRATDDEPSVVGAWVIVAPPKFAVHIDNVITLYDRVFQAMVDAGLETAPTTTSYTNDIYPILQRARDTKWVESVGFAHSSTAPRWTDPVTSNTFRNAIFNRLTAPAAAGTDMPDLNESLTNDGRLTPIQYAHMQRWRDGNYTDDWSGIPAPQADTTPAGLDRAALEHCVGGAFYPGIEAGGRSASERPIITAANYMEAFRLDHDVVDPGDITFTMALPWQADFNACADNWWPVPRPNDVIPQGQTSHFKWDRDVGGYEDMVQKWHTLGFIVQQGSQHIEVDRCNVPSITLLTPHLNFQDIPQGPMGMIREQPLSITFEVISPSSAVTLEYAPGGAPSHPQLVPFNSADTVGPTAANQVATARLWVIFRTGSIGAIPMQTVTVREAGGSQQWVITIRGNTVGRQTAATALVLDRSGSMSEDRGDGASKHASLQQAANIFVDVMLEGDGAGLVRYNQDAQSVQQVRQLGSGGLSDINRSSTKDLISGNSFDPQGATSIGDGIFVGREILNTTTDPYNIKALVVLTDGKENRSRYISEMAAQINEQTYAIGLGTPQNTSAPALQTISGNHGGFLLITGAIGQDNRFLLQKYFLQILAGVSNAEIVLDPEGELVRGQVHRIPFQMTDADSGVDVILLTPHTKIVDYRLQTPNGLILEPWRAMAEPGMRYVLSNGVSYYRLVLPTQLVAGRFDQGGTWHALLSIGRPRLEPTQDSEDGVDRSFLHGMHLAQPEEPMSQRRRLEAERASTIAAHEALLTNKAEFATPVSVPATRSRVLIDQRGTLPYSLIVHCYSSVSLTASAEQSSFESGAEIKLHATLTESGLPLPAERGTVWAEVRWPDGSVGTLTFAEQEEGRFMAHFDTTMAGVYHFRVRGNGRTRRGRPFTRERALTAAVWRGGDRDAEAAGEAGNRPVDVLRERDARLCKLLKCLTARPGALETVFEKCLNANDLDVDHLRKCLHLFCRGLDTTDNDVDG